LCGDFLSHALVAVGETQISSFVDYSMGENFVHVEATSEFIGASTCTPWFHVANFCEHPWAQCCFKGVLEPCKGKEVIRLKRIYYF
jgi:hypothetical protein